MYLPTRHAPADNVLIIYDRGCNNDAATVASFFKNFFIDFIEYGL